MEYNTEKEILKGCGEDYCGKFMYEGDKTQWDTLCGICKAKFSQNRETKKEIIKIIDKKIIEYKKNKLPKNNFTIEDRATAIVVLESLKKELN